MEATRPSLDEIQHRLEQLCERRCLAPFTAAETAEYSSLSVLERDLLAARRLCRT